MAKAINWLLRDSHPQQQAHLVLLTALGLQAVIAIGAALRWAMGPIKYWALLVAVCVFLVLSAVPWLLRCQQITAAGLTTAAAFLVLILGGVALSGGLRAPMSSLLPTVPLLATFLVGRRVGLAATGVVLVSIVALAAAGTPGVVDPSWWLTPGQDLKARALMLCLAVSIIGFFAATAELQRRGIEGKLRRRREKYRRLFAQSKDVVAVSSSGGRLVEMNQSGMDLYGFESREALRSFDARQLYIDPRERERLVELLADQGSVSSYESRHRTLDGREIVVQGTTSSILDDQGRVAYLLTILRDITEQRQNEGERARMISELKRKNEELESFAYAISHDLRGPLFTLRGFLELLEGDPRDEKLLDEVPRVVAVAERMATLLDHLLGLAKLGSNGVERAEVSMAEVAEEVADDLAAKLRATGVSLSIAEHLAQAVGDRTLIRTMLQNLVDNAVKFCAAEPRPRVRVDCDVAAEPAIFSVTDNGPGVRPEDREKIFKLFTKLDAESSGTGIGLAVVEKIVRLHGGEIWLAERPSRGASFCFTLAPSSGAGRPERSRDPEWSPMEAV